MLLYYIILADMASRKNHTSSSPIFHLQEKFIWIYEILFLYVAVLLKNLIDFDHHILYLKNVIASYA